MVMVACAPPRMMMWGNALGIPLSSLRARLQGSPDPGSSLAYEIGTPLGSLLVTPVALVHALLRGLWGAPFWPRPRDAEALSLHP